MTSTPRNQVLEPLRQVCEDLKDVDLGLTSTIDLFYREVEKRALSRGFQQILLLDLPKLGAVYDSGVSRGYLNFGDIPASFGKLSSSNFSDSWVFRTLLQHTFDGFGTFDPTTPVEVVWATRQLLYLYKKAKVNCPQEGIVNAVEDYIDIERTMRPFSGSWDSDIWVPCRYSFDGSFSADLRGYGLRRNFWSLLDLVFRELVPGVQLFAELVVPKHGPGAVSDVRTGDDKYRFPYWPDKLGGLFPPSQFAYPNESVAYFDPDDSLGLSPCEPPAKLIAVPKTYKGPRLIASEPTAHQFIQQGLMQWIRSNMPDALRTCVNFLDQSPSRAAALEASRTGDLATVDLSSASDRLSCWVVERAFSSNQSLLRALHSSRSRTVLIPRSMTARKGDLVSEDLVLRLKKFAAQGSAVTFPVQTVVYAAVAITSVLYDMGHPVQGVTMSQSAISSLVELVARKVRVFGDDIVLPSPNVQTLATALTALGLKVNASKTHYTGQFRESCGMDAYSGHDVTPVYIGDLQLQPGAEELASWVEISNLFHRAGLWRTAEWMLNQVPLNLRTAILISDSAGSGIRATTFCRGRRFHGKVRYNSELQRQEVRCLCLTTKVKRVARGSYQSLLQYFLERPSPETNWSSGFSGRAQASVRRLWVSSVY